MRKTLRQGTFDDLSGDWLKGSLENSTPLAIGVAKYARAKAIHPEKFGIVQRLRPGGHEDL